MRDYVRAFAHDASGEMHGGTGSTCPVCGRGEWEHPWPAPRKAAVSHLACVEKLEAINNTNRNGWRDAALENEHLRDENERITSMFNRSLEFLAPDSVLRKLRVAEDELAALKEDFKHLHSRWDYTQYWFANLYPVDWDRCQEKYNTTKTGART